MEKILMYVRQGRGLGMLFLLASAVLSAMVAIILLRDGYSAVKPEISLVANEFLPITVQNGKIADPVGVYKRIDLDFGGEGEKKELFPVVLDTRGGEETLPTEKQGLFITADTVYAVSVNKINRISLADVKDTVLTKDNFSKKLDSVMGLFSMIASVILIGILFLWYLLKTWLAAVAGAAFLKISGKKDRMNTGALMRLGSLIVAGTEFLFFVGGIYFGTGLSALNLLILEMAAVIAVLYFSVPAEPDKQS